MDCQDLMDPFVFIMIISCVEPCSWVEQQDVRGGSSLPRSAAAPAPKSKDEAARRPGILGELPLQQSYVDEPGRGCGVEKALHLLLHVLPKQGVEPHNSPGETFVSTFAVQIYS